MVHQCKPVGLREARIIWRMKHVLKLPVTKIAVVVERNKTSIYRALGPDFLRVSMYFRMKATGPIYDNYKATIRQL